MMPKTYDEWHQCITIKCKIPLTADFVEGRLLALQNLDEAQIKRFSELYGEEHRRQVIGWFQKALKDLQK